MKTYKVTINTDLDNISGLDFISFVEKPATELSFICFSKQEKPVRLQFDSSKHLVKGIAMECDKPIYRNSPTLGEHFVEFDKDCISKLMLKLSKTGLINSVDTQHNGKAVDGVYLVESYQIDREKGVNPIEFSEVNDFSWVVEYKIENEQFWNEIITTEQFNGFSISGLFEYIDDSKFSKEINPIDELIDEILND